MPVHGLIRELGRAREELCDNHVLQDRDAVSYGETLLHMAELSMRARPLRAAVGILHWRGELERRIAGFLDQRRSMRTRSQPLADRDRRLDLSHRRVRRLGDAAASPRPRKPGQPLRDLPTARNRIQPGHDDPPQRTMRVRVVGPDGRPMAGVRNHRAVWTRKPVPGAISTS